MVTCNVLEFVLITLSGRRYLMIFVVPPIKKSLKMTSNMTVVSAYPSGKMA